MEAYQYNVPYKVEQEGKICIKMNNNQKSKEKSKFVKTHKFIKH